MLRLGLRVIRAVVSSSVIVMSYRFGMPGSLLAPPDEVGWIEGG